MLHASMGLDRHMGHHQRWPWAYSREWGHYFDPEAVRLQADAVLSGFACFVVPRTYDDAVCFFRFCEYMQVQINSWPIVRCWNMTTATLSFKSWWCRRTWLCTLINWSTPAIQVSSEILDCFIRLIQCSDVIHWCYRNCSPMLKICFSIDVVD